MVSAPNITGFHTAVAAKMVEPATGLVVQAINRGI